MPKILLVDDEAYVTAAMSAKLTRCGHTVLRASDGLEGFNLATSFLPDLIVSDLQMPIMTGIDMAMKLRATPQTSAIPIILLTGRGHLIPQSELEMTCVKHLMQKPFSVRDLVERIDLQFPATV